MVLASISWRCWIVVLLVPSAAWAAPAPAPPPAASSAAAPSAGDAELDEATAAYARSQDLFARGLRREALAELERAYSIEPVPEVLYEIAEQSEELALWAKARRALELYLKLAARDITPERATEVRSRIEVLTKKTATLTLTVSVPGAEIHLDGAPVESTEISGLVVEPGAHVVRASKPGFKPFEQQLHANDGQDMVVLVPLTRSVGDELPGRTGQGAGASGARPESAPVRDAGDGGVALWVPWTITSALAAGWATTAALAIKARHDRDIIERPETSDERIDDARRLHMTLAVVSDILLVSTLASAGVSAYLTWWPEPSVSTVQHPGPSGLVDGLAIGVSGRF